MNDLVTLRRDIEKGSQIKQGLENEIMVKLQDQLMSNKAAKYFLQLSAKLQNRMTDLVCVILILMGLKDTRLHGQWKDFLLSLTILIASIL